MTRLIGIAGRKGVGKDTVADYLVSRRAICEPIGVALRTFKSVEDIVVPTVKVIGILSINNEHTKRFGKAGVCETMVMVMRAFADDAGVMTVCCETIVNLVGRDSVNSIRMMNAGACDTHTIRLLAKREGKTVIFCANPERSGMSVIYKILRATRSLWLDSSVDVDKYLLFLNEESGLKAAKDWQGIPLPSPRTQDTPCTRGENLKRGTNLCSATQPKDESEKILRTFACVDGMSTKSAVLRLGSKYFQGIDVTRAPGVPPPRAMIVLGETTSGMLDRQLWSRINRMCGFYDWPEHSVTIYKVALRIRGVETCDSALAWYKANHDRVSPMLMKIMERASLAPSLYSLFLWVSTIQTYS